jgi:hypothetical protein
MKVDQWSSSHAIDNLNLGPTHPLRETGSECLQDRLFGCETRGKMLEWPPFLRTGGQLARGKQRFEDSGVVGGEALHTVGTYQIHPHADLQAR